MRVNTYNLILSFKNGSKKEYKNISRVAMNRYIDWYLGRWNFVGFHFTENELKRSNNWLAGT